MSVTDKTVAITLHVPAKFRKALQDRAAEDKQTLEEFAIIKLAEALSTPEEVLRRIVAKRKQRQARQPQKVTIRKRVAKAKS